jgi:hypothetical protein
MATPTALPLQHHLKKTSSVKKNMSHLSHDSTHHSTVVVAEAARALSSPFASPAEPLQISQVEFEAWRSLQDTRELYLSTQTVQDKRNHNHKGNRQDQEIDKHHTHDVSSQEDSTSHSKHDSGVKTSSSSTHSRRRNEVATHQHDHSSKPDESTITSTHPSESSAGPSTSVLSSFHRRYDNQSKSGLWWTAALFIFINHLVCVYTVIYYASVSWKIIIASIFAAWLNLLGITAGYHRLWSHR